MLILEAIDAVLGEVRDPDATSSIFEVETYTKSLSQLKSNLQSHSVLQTR